MQGLFCSHLHALPLTPSAPETPKMSCLLSPSALLLPYLLHAPGKAACHYRSSRSQQSCHLQGSDALSQHQLADGQECAGTSLCREGVRNNEWPRPLPWEHFCGTGQLSTAGAHTLQWWLRSKDRRGLCMVSLLGFIDHTQEGTRDKEPRAEEGAGLYTEQGYTQWENWGPTGWGNRGSSEWDWWLTTHWDLGEE